MLLDFGDMTAYMGANTKLSPIVTELFLQGRKLNISLVFISQSYLKLSTTFRLNATHQFTMKRELQQTASNHLSDSEFKDSTKLYKGCTKEPTIRSSIKI